jgi:hypothetical protein
MAAVMTASVAGLFLGLTASENASSSAESAFWAPAILGLVLGILAAVASQRPGSVRVIAGATATKARFVTAGACLGLIVGVLGLVVLAAIEPAFGIGPAAFGLVACIVSGAVVTTGTLLTYGSPAR